MYTSSCVAIKPSPKFTLTGGSLKVEFTAKTAGTYIIGIKFNAKSVVGATAPNPTTVHYDFSTVGVPNSTNGLNLVKK
jgi:hypothetical protein